MSHLPAPVCGDRGVGPAVPASAARPAVLTASRRRARCSHQVPGRAMLGLCWGDPPEAEPRCPAGFCVPAHARARVRRTHTHGPRPGHRHASGWLSWGGLTWSWLTSCGPDRGPAPLDAQRPGVTAPSSAAPRAPDSPPEPARHRAESWSVEGPRPRVKPRHGTGIRTVFGSTALSVDLAFGRMDSVAHGAIPSGRDPARRVHARTGGRPTNVGGRGGHASVCPPPAHAVPVRSP